MKEFSIPAELSWHLMNDVHIPTNYDENFHWVLVVIDLNQRLIRVYYPSLGTKKQVYP